MLQFFRFMQTLDRRWVYLILATTLVVSLLYSRPIDPVVMPPVHAFYDTVNAAPANPGDGKIILVGTTFSASTQGESANQARAIFRHLMLTKKRFAVMAVGEPQGAKLGPDIVNDLAKQYGYEYGVDWINFGFQMNAMAFYTGFPRDMPGTIGTDANGRPLSEFEIMRGINTVRDDVALFIDITASNSVFNWIEIVQGRYGLKIGYACTGVMAAEAYPFLDSGQLFGMLPGLKGAADYEYLVDQQEREEIKAGRLDKPFDYTKQEKMRTTPARKLMFTQSAAHIVILLFIILGNIGLIVTRRRGAQSSPKEAA